MARPLFIPTQPQRCAGGQTGLTGNCLACGAKPTGLCIAPVSERNKPKQKAQR